MGFQMNFSREQISGKPPVPDGKYTLRLSTFEPAFSKPDPNNPGKEKTLNLNPKLEITGAGEHDNRRVFENLNMSAPWILNDFLHACGVPMEEVQDGKQGTEAASFSFPGIFEGSDQFPDEPEKWKYLGPLTNQTLEVELYTHDWKGRKSNKVKQYFCRVPGCQEKHSTNLAR